MPKGDATWPTMTLDECISFADEWSCGMSQQEIAQRWRSLCMLLAEEVRGLRAELDEQCRLLGMGSEREARLMAQLAESQAREAKMRAELEWQREHTYNPFEPANQCASHKRICAAIAIPPDDSALREMIEAAKADEREACIAAIRAADDCGCGVPCDCFGLDLP